MTQPQTNPFPYSDTNKRYQTFDYHARRRFGGKCVRVPLEAGFSCPNRPGGCVFCAGGSSGAAVRGTIAQQYSAGIARVSGKWAAERFIPYLQAGTNTFAPAAELERLYDECARLPGAVMLAIGTRADCLGDDVIDVLVRTSRKIPLLVELGMQTAHDATLSRIGRGYGHAAFCAGYSRLRRAGGDISIGLHILNGLPGEDRAMMLATAAEAARMAPDLVKLHTLCVLRGTPLAEDYAAGRYTPMTMDDAAALVCDQLTLLPPETVIARLSADAEREMLIAPLWTRNKRGFENEVDRRMYAGGRVQGERFRGADLVCG